MRALAATLLLVSCSTAPAAQGPAMPRSCGHAHNDEHNPRPLFGALELGFCSVEVDVQLVGDQLLVGHDLDETSPDKTLESMYLEPLAADPHPIFLLIDVKSDAAASWTAIDERLARFDLGPAQVVITGAIARDLIAQAPVRRAAMDGRIADLDAGADPTLFPIISDKWIDHFTWVGGVERFPPDQRIKLENLVKKAHDAGQKIRFWQTGERTEMWEAERDAGVDLINTDDLPGLAAFLGT